MRFLAPVAALVLAGAAQAATITAGVEPGVGTALDLNVSDFEGSGPRGFGNSVVGDGFSVVEKSNPNASHAYGRFDPLAPPSRWIDSQDMSEVAWTITYATAFTSLTFALTDAFDQLVDPKLGGSFFKLEAGGAEWSIDAREANGTLHWLTVTFDQPTTSATLNFFTRLNDGWGVSSPTVATVPLPASAWLLIAALGGIGAVARRKRMTA